MANVTESAVWDAGVYQLETTDPVAGGPSGIDNTPHKNLANRTAYLKAHVDAIESGASVPAGLATTAVMAAADTATLNSAKSYADGLVVGLWDDRGSFDASVNTFPTTGGSGAAGAILKGDIWTISVVATSGSLNGIPIGSTVRAMVDTPAQTVGNWDVLGVGTGYVPAQATGNSAQAFSVGAATAPAHAVRLDQLDPSLFYKADAFTPAFLKTGANTISVKAGSSVIVAGVKVSWAANTAITMPSLTAGNDYSIYACTDGTIHADISTTNPTGYTTGNSRKIGGFHYGQVASGTTVASGTFATTGNGMIWTQGDVDNIAGINQFSIWDLKFRPAAADPRGMVLVGGRTWVDIYLCSTDTATNGTSKAGSNIASHTVLPKIPAAFGGNGVTTYPSLNWWVANELARANKKRLMWEHEFVEAAYGVTENQSIDATASTYPTTQRNAGYTSKYGIEQASGHHWTWGQDSSAYQDVTGAGSYKTVTGNTGAAGSERGSIYTFGTYGLVRVILGGARAYGAVSGSRCSDWVVFPWNSSWSVGLRAACDHLQSV
ncbi:MAG TPA: hypothetical protein PKZ37_14665 [Gallionellaceae bacterium]|jgi:hypothetical protein|nr:hypothetical protein [Gallionellaceae bacterium]